MSRKRSHEMRPLPPRALPRGGASVTCGADSQTAERVWEMVEGFAGFGFPKAHGAAFGLLAYQSTWLRVHYGAEFLCALLNEQPMGFYAPDSLVHEAENRREGDRIEVLGVDVNASHVQCTVEDGAVRLGLGYIKGAAKAEMQALVAERERGGPFTGLGELAGRVACSRATLEQLAWSGACDALTEAVDTRMGVGGDEGALHGGWRAGRRTALWQLGIAASAEAVGGEQEREATQLALPLELPTAPRLRTLGRWQRLIADYSTSGVTIGEHALAVLRERLVVPGGVDSVVRDNRVVRDDRILLATSAQLALLPTGSRVAVAGLVIARQRPGTAKGTMFLLFEDEFGTINLIVPRAVYERHRPLARAEPLLLAFGRLERSQQSPGPDERPEELRPVVNVIVRELAALERFIPGGLEGEGASQAGGGRVHRLPAPERAAQGVATSPEREEEDAPAAQVGSSMRAVAPPVQSFAMGRRR